MVTLTSSSPIPLYIQLKDVLIKKIKTGEWPAGFKLPSELDLCKLYSISRNTVRGAIAELSSEGILVCKQGKGTFVNYQKVEENISANQSFTSVCIANGMKPSNKLITLALQPAGPKDRAALGIDQDEKIVYIERVLMGNQIPVIYDQVYLSGRFSTILKENLEGVSLYATLHRVFNIVPKRSHKTIELAYANQREASLLNIRKDSPVLLMNEVVYDFENSPVHRTRQIILGDRFKYVIN
jgi:GntR family transcriptional regulator